MTNKTDRRTTRVRAQDRKNIAVGQAHIKSTFNNTIVSITDPQRQRHRLAARPARLGSRAPASPRRSRRRWPPRRLRQDRRWSTACKQGGRLREGPRQRAARPPSARSRPPAWRSRASRTSTPTPAQRLPSASSVVACKLRKDNQVMAVDRTPVLKRCRSSSAASTPSCWAIREDVQDVSPRSSARRQESEYGTSASREAEGQVHLRCAREAVPRVLPRRPFACPAFPPTT